MPLHYGVAGLKQTATSLSALFTDPSPLASGAVAGVVARAAVLPVDAGARKGMAATLRLRGAYFALLAWAYVPLHRRAQFEFTTADTPAEMRMYRTMLCGAFAGLTARFLLNPYLKARGVAMRYGMDTVDASRNIRASYLGTAGFFTNEHPIMCNAAYTCLLFTSFEAMRRVADADGYVPRNVVGQALAHAVIGGTASALASTLTYRMSYPAYADVMIRESSVLQGRRMALVKEVPMMAVFFGAFTVAQAVVSPHHMRAGFGY